jgi:hypothetical protein
MELRELASNIRWSQKVLMASLLQLSTSIMQGSDTGPINDLLLTYIRGPEVEFWLGGADDVDPAKENDWTLLPFMALSDGAHTWAYKSPLPVHITHHSPERQKSSLILPSCEKLRTHYQRPRYLAYHARGRYLPAS